MRHKGFTLIETLLALFITAILIAILAVVFNTGLRSYRQGKDLLEITRKAQLILGQMTRELKGAMVQVGHISFEINDSRNNDSIYFMAPITSSSSLDLCEIGYYLSDTDGDGVNDLLIRHFDNVGSGYQSGQPVIYGAGGINDTFCTNVVGFNIGHRLVSSRSWLYTRQTSSTQIPEMVEITVTIQGIYGSPAQTKTFTSWVYIPNSTVNP